MCMDWVSKMLGALTGLALFCGAAWVLYEVRYPHVERAPVAVLDGYRTTPSLLTLFVEACHSEPEVVEYQETATEVQLRIEGDAPSGGVGNACADGVEVPLRSPLGSRLVRDLTTGSPVQING